MKELFHLYEFIARRASPEELKRLRDSTGVLKVFKGSMQSTVTEGLFLDWEIKVFLDKMEVAVRYRYMGREEVRRMLFSWEPHKKTGRDKLVISYPDAPAWRPHRLLPPFSDYKARILTRKATGFLFSEDAIRDVIIEALEYQMEQRKARGLF